MGNRRKAREASLQLLYEIETSHKGTERVLGEFSENPSRLFAHWQEALNNPEEIKEFSVQISRGVWDNVHEIDRLIEEHSTHWKITRMALVDRNILRMAVFELLYCPDIPASVTINEAIEIAKKYGTEESGAFVNGILDHIAKALKKN